jgi:hypothetical protein
VEEPTDDERLDSGFVDEVCILILLGHMYV